VDLSIIVVNWNCAAYTEQCIASVLATTGDLDYEIIVVDNASTDDSRDVLSRGFDRTSLVWSPENLGFARGNNLGFERSNGKSVLFLNPDTLVLGNALSRMHVALTASPNVGAVGCRLLNADRSVQTSCVQPFPTIANQLADIEWFKRRLPRLPMWGMAPLFETRHEGPADVQAVSGACLMIKRSVFEQVDRFSTDYFMYTEDIDLCYKVRGAGLKVCYVGDAEIVHYGGQSSTKSETDGFADIVMRESIYRFLGKTRGKTYAASYRRAIGIAALTRIMLLRVALWLPLDRAALRSSIKRWRRIGNWSRGQESWAAQLGTQDSTGAAA
jgi:GT2 family glycosyltransferase